jgi:uncharacterized membrane protein
MTRRTRGERGSVSLIVVLFIPALLLAAGLVLDGGRQLQARRDADAAASAAARAAVQLSRPEAFARQLDPGQAVSRGEAELARQGMSGSVTVSGEIVRVTVTTHVDFYLLPGGRTVSGNGTADALMGVNDGS